MQPGLSLPRPLLPLSTLPSAAARTEPRERPGMPAQLPAHLPVLSVPEVFCWSGLRFAGLADHLHRSWGAGPWGQIVLILHRQQLVGPELCTGWAYVGRRTWPVAVNQGGGIKKGQKGSDVHL